MSLVRTVTLELLRPGPEHNQLLSPLTPYTAVCDDRSASTVHLPFEHRQFLAQFRALCRPSERHLHADLLAQSLGQLIGGVPSLLAAVASVPHGQGSLTHLRLILSASELSLLPFELALAPAGFPSAGRSLFHQIEQPLSLTREVRGNRAQQHDWTRPPKILVVSAAAANLAPVPLRAHLLALRQAVSRWAQLPGTRVGRSIAEDLITVLPNATLGEIRSACAARNYTHVHILSHGLTYDQNGEERFGLVLQDRLGGSTVVSGDDLAAALRVRRSNGSMSSPLWVTLCTCDSGRVGSVVLPGGSMAHALQAAGIPWVLASQFPLSMQASVLLTSHLYPDLLCGKDPRGTLCSLRRILHADCPQTFDWASLVVYASLPADFADQLRVAQRMRVHEAVGIVFHRAEAYMRNPTREPEQQQLLQSELDRCREELESALPIATSASAGSASERAEVYGLLGSLERNRAYLLCSLDSQRVARNEALEHARELYLKAAWNDCGSLWCAVHFLSICAVLGRLEEPASRHWMRASLAFAELYRHETGTQLGVERSLLGLLALVELRLLTLLTADYEASKMAPEGEVVRDAEELARKAASAPREVSRLLRRLRRYQDEHWWRKQPAPRFSAALKDVIDRIEAARAS